MRRSTLSSPSTFAAAILFIAIATDGASQSFQGGLRGAVTDANSVIPGVMVTLINEGTTVSRDDREQRARRNTCLRRWRLEPTPCARCSRDSRRSNGKGLTIGTQQFVTVDLVMEVGMIEESISVTADAPLLETSNASLGEVLDKANAGRTAGAQSQRLHGSGDGADGDRDWRSVTSAGWKTRATGRCSRSAAAEASRNNYLLDGVAVTDLQNRTSVFVSTEAINEVKVQVHTYDAEMGRSGGGVFNTTGKSGSNAFHGSAFYPESSELGGSPTTSLPSAPGSPKITDGPYYRYWGGSVEADQRFATRPSSGWHTRDTARTRRRPGS